MFFFLHLFIYLFFVFFILFFSSLKNYETVNPKPRYSNIIPLLKYETHME